VSFSVGEGECLALVGESGSGKTTLGRCIVGLHAAAGGRIEFRGESVSYRLGDRPGRARRAIQMVFQNPDRSLNPVRTVAGTLERSLRLGGVTRGAPIQSESARLLDSVRLPTSALGRFPRELSGGERQRVAIAAALALSPSLLVCDEVTSALDVSVQASVMELLMELQRDGLTLLFITHNLALVASIAERLVVLESGVVSESSPVEGVLLRPTQGSTQRLLADIPRITTEFQP
jgi:peptide/nickel transport system ATP-binding protein